MNIEEDWFVWSIISWKLKYFGNIKHHSDIQRTWMNCVVPWRQDTGCLTWWWWREDVKDALDIKFEKYLSAQARVIF